MARKYVTPRKGRGRGIAGTGIKSDTALLVGGGLLALYMITRPGEGGGPAGPEGAAGEAGKSILQNWTDSVTKSIAGTAVGVLEVPGAIVFGLPKKIVEISEEQTSQQIFGGQARTGVSSFFATAPPYSTFGKPVTYKEFMAEQPIAFRGAATAGNILTGQVAAQYGAYAAEETKKGQARAGREPGEYAARFSRQEPWMQALLGLGQIVTVPFGGGGASGWGAALTPGPGTKKDIAKDAVFGGKWAQTSPPVDPTGGKGFGGKWEETVKKVPTSPTLPILPFQKEAVTAYGSNVIAKAYWGDTNKEVFGPPSPTKKESAITIPKGYSATKLPGMDVYRMIDGQKVWR